MTLDAGTLVTLGFAGVAVIVWLVRLEGRVNGKATSDQIGSVSSQIAAVAGIVSSLQAKEASYDQTRDEVIRLQEQIKNLAVLIERLLPAARRRAVE